MMLGSKVGVGNNADDDDDDGRRCSEEGRWTSEE